MRLPGSRIVLNAVLSGLPQRMVSAAMAASAWLTAVTIRGNRNGARAKVAYFTAAPTTAALKVSFFGPFYGGYNVIALDSQYQYALVSGPDRGYLWILSRTPTIPESIKQEYLRIARDLGFPVEKLVWVNHG